MPMPMCRAAVHWSGTRPAAFAASRRTVIFRFHAFDPLCGELERDVEVECLDDHKSARSRFQRRSALAIRLEPVGHLVRHLYHVLQSVGYRGRRAGR